MESKTFIKNNFLLRNLVVTALLIAILTTIVSRVTADESSSEVYVIELYSDVPDWAKEQWGPIGLNVIAGEYKLKSGTTCCAGSKIFLPEDWMTFPSGLIIEVGEGGVTLRGKYYKEGSLFQVNQEGDLVTPAALGKIGDTRAVEALIATLKHEYFLVRRYAAKALGKIGNTRAVESLIAALRDENKYVRWGVVKALGKIKDPRSVEPLIAALKDKNRRVREEAATALEEITEKDFGKDPVKWEKWWEKKKQK